MAGLGIQLTPEETGAALDGVRVTPAESRGRDNGPRSSRMSKDPNRRGQPEDTVDENARLGLTTGLADPRLPDEDMDLSGDALATAGPELSPVEKQERARRHGEHPFEGDVAFLKEAAPFTVGGALGAGAKMLLGRAATSGASSAAARGAEEAARWLANSMHHGTLQSLPISVLKAMFPELGAAIGASARATATGIGMAAPGVGAVGAGGMLSGGQPEETQEQKAARVLLGMSPNFVER